MKSSASMMDIFLNPGEVYFGDRDTRVRTILGSCVAITVWHPQLRIGGMCHFVLPARNRTKIQDLDGRYADEAILLLLKEILRKQTDPYSYQVKLFGGGNMVDRYGGAAGGRLSVANRNVIAGRELLEEHGFAVAAEHLGGFGHRNVIFDIDSGDVWVKQTSPL